MSNSEKYWERMSKNIKDQSQTYNKHTDISAKDASFIKKYLSKTDSIIDIGSGSGAVTNKLLPFVNEITAVETFRGLSEFITEAPNMIVINAKIEGFYIRKKFDIAISTGLMQFFKRPDAEGIYTNLFDMLKKDGLFIMRLHCGLKETVVINHSKELDQEYFAEFRQVDEERKLLEEIGFSKVEVIDEAPEELNIYDNTRHFMFVCKK
jgi:SAM-dependent methyltransferase